jgi:hypothetical protein
MPFQRPSRRPRARSVLPRVLASVLAAAGLVLALASCSHITPLGPVPIQFSPTQQLRSPIVVQVMRLQPPTASGDCPAGWVGISLPAGGGPRVSAAARAVGAPHPIGTVQIVNPHGASASPSPSPPASPRATLAPAITCYRPAGAPVTITSAAVSAVLTYHPPPDQPKAPALYGFIVAVPSVDVSAVTAIIKQAYDTQSAVGISVAGKLWQAPTVPKPFAGLRLSISLLSRTQAHQLYRLVVPSG